MRLKEADEIVLSRGFNDEVEVQGRTRQPIGDESDTANHRVMESVLFKEIGDDPEYFLEIQGCYPTTGNTVPACFGASRPGSNPATSHSAASV